MVERTYVAFRLRPNGVRKDWLMIEWYEQEGRHHLAARLLQDVEGGIGSGIAAHALPLDIEALEAWLFHDRAWSVTPEDWERLRDWCASNGIPPDAAAAKSLEPPARTAAPRRPPGPDEWADAARLARAGDTQAARDILREFVETVELSSESAWSVPVPRVCAQYIADAFRQILNRNVDARRALNLSAPKAGRPAGTKMHDQVSLAAAYWLLVRHGYAPEQANQRVQMSAHADRTTIQDAARACSAFEDAALFDEPLLLAIVRDHRALAQMLNCLQVRPKLRE